MTEAPTKTDPPLAPNGWPKTLLTGFRNGERSALTEIYRMHAPDIAQMLRFGFRFTSGKSNHRFVGYTSAFELQDVLQETFRRAFEPSTRQNYDGLRPFGAYLSTIARNLVLRGFREKEVQFPEISSEGNLASQAANVSTAQEHEQAPDDLLQRKQLRLRVQAFLEVLGEEDRELMTLRFCQGLSQRDVAEQLGIGRQRIRSRELRLKERFIGYMAQHGISDLNLVALLLPLLGGLQHNHKGLP